MLAVQRLSFATGLFFPASRELFDFLQLSGELFSEADSVVCFFYFLGKREYVI